MTFVITGIAASLITALGAMLLARYSKSGRIKTSEAVDLWTTLRSELTRLQEEAVRLRAEITVGQQEMAALRVEATEIRVRMAEVQAQLVICSATLKEYESG